MARLSDVQAQAEAGEFATAINEDEWHALSSRGRLRRFPRGAHLLLEGAQSDVVYVVLAGRVKVVSSTGEGDEVVLALRGPGTLVGELAALDDQPRSASVLAIDPVEALAVPAAAFNDFLLASPRVALVLTRTLVARLRETDRRRAEFGTLDTESRVARRLIELADRFGAAGARGVRITLPITQDDLAGWIGASREAVVKALRTRGWIETERRAVVIQDVEALRRRAGLD